jgi:hypothetical protein
MPSSVLLGFVPLYETLKIGFLAVAQVLRWFYT